MLAARLAPRARSVTRRAATDPVAAASRSDAAKRKDQTKHTAEGLPVQRFRSLLGHLATLTVDPPAQVKALPSFRSPTGVGNRASGRRSARRRLRRPSGLGPCNADQRGLHADGRDRATSIGRPVNASSDNE